MAKLFGSFGMSDDAEAIRSAIAQMTDSQETPHRDVYATDRGFVGVQPGITASGFVLSNCRTSGFCIAPHIPRQTQQDLQDLRELARSFVLEYPNQGISALASLSGSSCTALLDPDNKAVLLASDRMGIQQLFFALRDDGIVFASSVDLLRRHPTMGSRVSAQALFDYMYFHVVPAPDVIFSGMSRLLPGEYLTWGEQKLERRHYWNLEFDEHLRRPFADLKVEFIESLTAAVGNCSGKARTGAFLSGGTDSSTIAGLLRKHRQEPIDTYSIGFGVEGYDELEYARITARHFGTRHHEYCVTPDDVVDVIPKIAKLCDQPFGNSSVVPAYYCAKLAAEDGIELMLAGDGGDELFGGNARYATQGLFSFYERLPRPLRSALVEPAVSLIPNGIPALRKVRGYVEKARIPMPARTEIHNLLHHFGYEDIFSRDVLRLVDVERPLKLQSEAYFNPTASSLINRQLAMDMKFTLADNDLPKVCRACELAGLPVAFPMLDQRVVDFSLRLAPDLKLKGMKLRYFFKEALRGFLPDATLRKTKHGFGLPFGPWLVSHQRLREVAFDSLTDLRKRRMFADALFDRLPRQLPEHPPYYGTMIWLLMMLEQWFQHHASAADGRSL